MKKKKRLEKNGKFGQRSDSETNSSYVSQITIPYHSIQLYNPQTLLASDLLGNAEASSRPLGMWNAECPISLVFQLGYLALQQVLATSI